MLLSDKIVGYKSLSIVGLEKNTGKTECLNYILHSIHKNSGKTIAVSSIGLDGETTDQLMQTAKPEISLYEGMWFVTSEKHYREKQLTAIIDETSERNSALGKTVTARALNKGNIILAGPSDTAGIKAMIARLKKKGVDTVIVDGALSRLSAGAPTVTEAMILATGAAVSGNIPELVYRTKFIYDLICLEEVDFILKNSLSGIENGVYAISKEEGMDIVHDLNIASSLLFKKNSSNEDIFRYGHHLFVSGIVGNKFLDFLKLQPVPVNLVVRDFSRIFVTPEVFYAYLKKGHTLQVLDRNNLLAICVNPQSPEGYLLDSDTLCDALRREVEVPVVDVRKIETDYVV